MTNLPERMTTAEVCALARFSAQTLARRRRADPGWLPAAPVQGGKQTLYVRADVLKALGMTSHVQTETPAAAEWGFDADAFRQARSRLLRHGSSTHERHVPGIFSGARPPAPLRLAVSNPAAHIR